jgi:hypothetical protein
MGAKTPGYLWQSKLFGIYSKNSKDNFNYLSSGYTRFIWYADGF